VCVCERESVDRKRKREREKRKWVKNLQRYFVAKFDPTFLKTRRSL
jgi:hypothetical protein